MDPMDLIKRHQQMQRKINHVSVGHIDLHATPPICHITAQCHATHTPTAAVLECVILLGRKSSPISPCSQSFAGCGRVRSCSWEVFPFRGNFASRENLGCWVLWNKHNAQQVNSFASGGGVLWKNRVGNVWKVIRGKFICFLVFKGKFIILLPSCMLDTTGICDTLGSRS